MKVYELTKEDWSGVGGPMGTQDTYVDWRRLFATRKAARKYAQEDNHWPINWNKSGDGEWFSGDLRTHAYYIRKVKVNE